MSDDIVTEREPTARSMEEALQATGWWVAEFMMERSIATGHGDTIEDLLREHYAGARLAQRKRDEEIALRYKLESYIAEQIANAIRSQGDEP